MRDTRPVPETHEDGRRLEASFQTNATVLLLELLLGSAEASIDQTRAVVAKQKRYDIA